MTKYPDDPVHLVMRTALETEGLAFEYNAEFEQYLATLKVDTRKKPGCTLRYDRANETIVCAVMHHSRLSQDNLPAVVEYITRVNYNLSFGSFDLDIDNCAIQFRTGVSFFSTDAVQAIVQNVLRDAIGGFQFFMPSLLSVDAGKVEAIDAYEAVWQSG
jgi:hypothetical protein